MLVYQSLKETWSPELVQFGMEHTICERLIQKMIVMNNYYKIQNKSLYTIIYKSNLVIYVIQYTRIRKINGLRKLVSIFGRTGMKVNSSNYTSGSLNFHT